MLFGVVTLSSKRVGAVSFQELFLFTLLWWRPPATRSRHGVEPQVGDRTPSTDAIVASAGGAHTSTLAGGATTEPDVGAGQMKITLPNQV